jgi:pimeloyl-ACP methyl ester carboxylesterase
LAGTHRVITYDVCGHGRSAKPPGPYHLAAFGRQAAELIEAVAHGPAHVVGLSMGGMIGFQLAVDRPDLLASLTIVNSGPELVPRNWQERLALWLRVATVRWLGLERMGAILAERLFPEPDQAAGRAQFLARFLENDRDAYLAATKALIGWRVTDRIGAIPCPVLVVASDRDYTPPSRKEGYVRLLPNARMVVIPDAHHAVTAERPEAFNEVLTTFLASLPA